MYSQRFPKKILMQNIEYRTIPISIFFYMNINFPFNRHSLGTSEGSSHTSGNPACTFRRVGRPRRRKQSDVE